MSEHHKQRGERGASGPRPHELVRARPRRSAPRARRGDCTPAARERPLRLLAGRTLPMSEDERARLTGALAELLADWLTSHPERLPRGLAIPSES